jgi:ankyrin repeat protein
MQRNWEKTSGSRVDYLQITPYEVVIGSHWGTAASDNATARSHQEFLAGDLQSVARQTFGDEILAEVIRQLGGEVAAPAETQPQLQSDPEKEMQLRQAADVGDVAAILRLVAEGTDVNGRDSQGFTALYYAMNWYPHLRHKEHLAVVKTLVELGADVNASLSNGQTPLYDAAAWGLYEVVVYLHQQGAAVNTTLNTGENALLIIAKKNENRPLNFAVTRQVGSQKVTLTDPEAIRQAIGGHPDDEYRAYLKTVEYLIQHGLALNGRLVNTNQTPLFAPAESGLTEMVALILAANVVDVNQQDKWGLTALHFASRAGHLAMVDLLLEAGTAVNTADQYGFTPLHEAAERGHQPVVDLLLAHGADPKLGLTVDYAPYGRGDTPLDVARTAGKSISL